MRRGFEARKLESRGRLAKSSQRVGFGHRDETTFDDDHES